MEALRDIVLQDPGTVLRQRDSLTLRVSVKDKKNLDLEVARGRERYHMFSPSFRSYWFKFIHPRNRVRVAY